MNKSKLITVFVISVILVSCGSSSKLLKSENKILTEEIKSLENENKKQGFVLVMVSLFIHLQAKEL